MCAAQVSLRSAAIDYLCFQSLDAPGGYVGAEGWLLLGRSTAWKQGVLRRRTFVDFFILDLSVMFAIFNLGVYTLIINTHDNSDYLQSSC